uniref:Uncharacterized protein n=1 Tax=Anguilla anguilla TaxID=7936 RepID=A0A0E9XAA3_ANGAN
MSVLPIFYYPGSMGSLNIDPVPVLEEAFCLYCSTCTVFEGIDCHTLTHCPKHINGKGFPFRKFAHSPTASGTLLRS